jgi:hypothetical protein
MMTTTSDFAIIAVPLTLAVLALLVLGRRHIHGQMEQIAAAAGTRAAARNTRPVASNATTPRACVTTVPLEDLYVQDAPPQAASSRDLAHALVPQ